MIPGHLGAEDLGAAHDYKNFKSGRLWIGKLGNGRLGMQIDENRAEDS